MTRASYKTLIPFQTSLLALEACVVCHRPELVFSLRSSVLGFLFEISYSPASTPPFKSSSGEMENLAANHLPEVDSLPDGFVESSAELSIPRTPTFVQEKRPVSLLEADCSSGKIHDLSSSSDSLSASETRLSESRVEKPQKLRTFPVQLSEKDGFDDESRDVAELGDKLVQEGCKTGSVGICELENSISETSTTMSCNKELMMGSSCGHGHVERTKQMSDSAVEGCSKPHGTEPLQNRKLETSEVKRKNVKRSFKSEKEFLEFTLKHQQIIAERDAAIAVRDKLESLCRELQRQNKILMDECKRVSAEGQTMRLDLSTKFHEAIKDVSNKLEEQKDECLSQLKENEMLRNKLKHLAEQYALSEQQFTQKLKQKTLELQLADLKIQQHEEKLSQEKSQMQLYAEQVSQLLETEKNLRLQLAADGEKFQQFQEALLKSNEVFETFKQEIEKTAKSIKELKKENVFLKRKCEKSDAAFGGLVEEHAHLKKQLEKLKNQKEKLESLCRSLQAERKQNASGGNSFPGGPKIASSTTTEEDEVRKHDSVTSNPMPKEHEVISVSELQEEPRR